MTLYAHEALIYKHLIHFRFAAIVKLGKEVTYLIAHLLPLLRVLVHLPYNVDAFQLRRIDLQGEVKLRFFCLCGTLVAEAIIVFLFRGNGEEQVIFSFVDHQEHLHDACKAYRVDFVNDGRIC